MTLDLSVQIDSLTEKTQELIDLQQKLIDELKKKYTEVYNFFEENKIDLRRLSLFGKQITAGVIVTFSLFTINPTVNTASFDTSKIDEVKKFQTIGQMDVSDLSAEDKKALRVWQDYGDYIIEASQKYNIDPKVLFATVMTESMGNTTATRYEPHLNDSSYGLGQLLYTTARWIGYEGTPQGLFEPKTNIELIARYHFRNIQAYGPLTPEQLATAYNAGSPYSTPTFGHVDKFMKWYQKAEGFMVS